MKKELAILLVIFFLISEPVTAYAASKSEAPPWHYLIDRSNVVERSQFNSQTQSSYTLIDDDWWNCKGSFWDDVDSHFVYSSGQKRFWFKFDPYTGDLLYCGSIIDHFVQYYYSFMYDDNGRLISHSRHENNRTVITRTINYSNGQMADGLTIIDDKVKILPLTSKEPYIDTVSINGHEIECVDYATGLIGYNLFVMDSFFDSLTNSVEDRNVFTIKFYYDGYAHSCILFGDVTDVFPQYREYATEEYQANASGKWLYYEDDNMPNRFLIKAGDSFEGNELLLPSTHTLQFIHGGKIQLPDGFQNISTDEPHALHGYYYDYYNDTQDMTISFSEVMAQEYPEREENIIQSEYGFLKRTQPKATYATKSDNEFTLSGYSGENIYYIHYKLNNGVVYTVSFFYPTANRNVCDRIVEQVVDSFDSASSESSHQQDAQAPSVIVPSSKNEQNSIFDETYWFMSGDGGVNFVFYGLFHKNGSFVAKSFMEGDSFGRYYNGTYIYQNGVLTLNFYWFDYYGLHYSFVSDGYGGFYDPGSEPGTGFYIQPLEDSLVKLF